MRATITCWSATVQIECEHPSAMEALHTDFGPFYATEPFSLPKGEEAEQVVLAPPEPTTTVWRSLLPEGAQLGLVDPTGPMTQWFTNEQEYLLWPGRYAVIRTPACNMTMIRYVQGQDPYPVVRSEVTQALRRSLNRAGRWVLHAGLLWHPQQGDALLLPAKKGSGKTSACLIGQEAGLKIVTDELTVLTPSDLEASGIPRRLGLTPESITRFFPDMNTNGLPRFCSPLDGREKYLVRPPSLVTGPPPSVRLTAILIPTIWRSATAKIEAIGRDEAQLALYEATTANEGGVGQIYLEARRLSQELPAFRLLMGQEMSQNAQVLTDWLNRQVVA